MTIIKNINPVRNLARALRARRAFGRAIFNGVKENKGRVTLASLLIVSLMLATAGLYVFVSNANAAAITSAKDVLSSPVPEASANHTLTFTINDAIDAGNTLTIDVADGTFTFGTTGFANTDPLDYDITDDGAEKTIAADGACVAEGFEIDSITDSVFQFTYCAGSTAIASGSVIVVEIGTNATNGGAGDTQMTNPVKIAAVGTADTPTITIGGTFGGTGDILVATIEGVTVSVTIDESLSFSIAGVTNINCTQGGDATQVTTTAITVPFGSSGLAANTFYKGCHDLTVSTNAASGYSVTNEVNTSLLRTGTDSGDKTIDNAICDDGSCTAVIGTATTTPWATATANGFGYTCSGTACSTEFNTASEFNRFVCTGSVANCDPGDGGEAVAANTTPITSATAVSGQVSRIVYKLSFGGTQPPGSYSNTVIYVATPTF